MFDVAAFEVIRSPRRPALADDARLELSGPLVREVARLLETSTDGMRDPAIQDLLIQFSTTQVDPLPYADGSAVGDGLEHILLGVLGELERWLHRNGDRPTGEELAKKVRELAKAFESRSGGVWERALSQALQTLPDWILFWIATGQLDKVARGTRLLLVASLAATLAADLAKLTPDRVWDLLNRRIPVLPARLEALFTQAKVQLVREASVADLHVVRSEWRCYVPGEIATIRNIMAGESFHNEQKQLREKEVTLASETDTTQTSERTDEQSQQTEFSQSVTSAVQAQIAGFVRFEYAQGFSEYSHYKVNGGVDGGLSIARSEQQASRIARQSVSRAITRVETRTRESRLERTLARTEDLTDYTLKNDSANNRRGVYRWVDRIDRYQLFRYPDRLQLEFQLPEPAEYYRWRTQDSANKAALKAPPDWADLDPAQLTEANALELAIRYRASNLPVLPDQKVSVVQVLTGSPTAEAVPASGTVTWKAPEVIKELELAVPSGYKATKVTYSGTATAARGNWHREQTGGLGDDDLEGFHSIVMNVLVGTSSTGYRRGGRLAAGLEDTNTVQGWGDSAPNKVQFGEAMLAVADGSGIPVSVTIQPGAVDKLKLGVHAVGAATASVTFVMECERSPERLSAWQYAVYDALYAAWSEWNKEWQATQTRSALVQALPTGESSGARNALIVRDELKRQVVSWLLAESPFAGRPAFQALPTGGDGKPLPTWHQIDLDRARTDAPVIQFLEQAFEWSNMTYVFYPYYWADVGRWDELANLDGVDPDFERFLKAGSARVVLPARPGMEAAVHHWLIYQEPFLGQPMPLPGDDMYVSVATEIRDLTRPPEDGEPGDSWETRLGTTLVWLDEDTGKLPKNELVSLGQAPHEPTTLLCPK